MSERPRDLVFISCHQNDRAWLERLGVHLSPLLRRGSLTFWSAAEVPAGGDIGAEVCQALSHACVIILLVSADYLASIEIVNMKKLAEAQGVALLWIPVRSSAYAVTELAMIAPLCDPERPLSLLRRRDSELALVRICERIVSTVKTQGLYADSRSRFTWDNFANRTRKHFAAFIKHCQVANILLILLAITGSSIILLSINQNTLSFPSTIKPINDSEGPSKAPLYEANQYHNQIETIDQNQKEDIPVLPPEEWAMAAVSIGENNIKIITEIEKTNTNSTFFRRATLIDKRTNKTIAFMIYTSAHVKSWQSSKSESAKILRMIDLSIIKNEKSIVEAINKNSVLLIAASKKSVSREVDSALHDMGTSSVTEDRDASSVLVHDMGTSSEIHDIGTNSVEAGISTHMDSLPDPFLKKRTPKIVPESFMQEYIINMEQPQIAEKTKYKIICQDAIGSYKVCINEIGKVSDVQVLSGIADAEADAELVYYIKKWLFKPQNRSICFVKQLSYFVKDDINCKKKYAKGGTLSKDNISGDDPHLPDHAKNLLSGKLIKSAYRICVGVDGRVSEVTPMKSIDKAIHFEGADKNIMDTMKTWRYKPQPAEICFVQFLEYDIN